jgi:hypothetical protein
MMNYNLFSTHALIKLLDQAAAGSAQHKAIEQELRRRQRDVASSREDTGTLEMIFTGAEFEASRAGGEICHGFERKNY